MGIAPLGDSEVFVAALAEADVATPVVSNDLRSRRNGALNEAAEGPGAAIGHDGKPDTPSVTARLAFFELGAWFALADFDSACDQHFVGDAPSLAARSTADPAFIDLDVLVRLAADPILIRTNHSSAEFVEYLECRFIARQSKLPLELHCRDAGRLAGDQIGRPEPHAQRRVSALHNRSYRQANVATALAAAQNPGSVYETERLSSRLLAMGADEPIAPPSLLQVGGARRVIGKQPLEIGK